MLLALLPLLSLLHPALTSPLPLPNDLSNTNIPSIHDSAILARRIMNLTTLGTLSSIFPPSASSQGTLLSTPPSSVSGAPIGLPEYLADCEPHTNNPTLLAMPIATYYKNAVAGSNLSLSLRWHPPHPPSNDPFLAGPAAMPRFALIGYLERLSEDETRRGGVRECFTASHPDAKAWVPGNDIHVSEWARFVVREVYWFGGYGDRAYIGWISGEEWNAVTREEWEAVRLPGEVPVVGMGEEEL